MVHAIGLKDATRVDSKRGVVAPIAGLEDRTGTVPIEGYRIPPVEIPGVLGILCGRDSSDKLRQIVGGNGSVIVGPVLDGERANPKTFAVGVEDRSRVEVAESVCE